MFTGKFMIENKTLNRKSAFLNFVLMNRMRNTEKGSNFNLQSRW